MRDGETCERNAGEAAGSRQTPGGWLELEDAAPRRRPVSKKNHDGNEKTTHRRALHSFRAPPLRVVRLGGKASTRQRRRVGCLAPHWVGGLGGGGANERHPCAGLTPLLTATLVMTQHARARRLLSRCSLDPGVRRERGRGPPLNPSKACLGRCEASRDDASTLEHAGTGGFWFFNTGDEVLMMKNLK